jgi:hypothetical protein
VIMKILIPTGGVSSSRGLLGENFDFRTFIEMLFSLKMDADHCIEWIDLDLDLGDVGSKPGPMSVVVTRSKAFIPSNDLVSSNADPKGKAPMGSRGARAKFSFKPKTKLSHKWRGVTGVK